MPTRASNAGLAAGAGVAFALIIIALANRDPGPADVCVRVDTATDATFSRQAESVIKTAFHQHGYVIEFERGDQPIQHAGEMTTPEWRDLQGTEIVRPEGCYHLLVVSEWSGRSDGGASLPPGWTVVGELDDTLNMASLVMHEMGHSAGIMPDMEGVGDSPHTIEEYPSVMNYDGLYEIVTYSDGNDNVGRDEWEIVAGGPSE